MLIIKGHARPCGMSKYGFKSHTVFLFSLVKMNSLGFFNAKKMQECVRQSMDLNVGVYDVLSTTEQFQHCSRL
jgi:hypothetical protein